MDTVNTNPTVSTSNYSYTQNCPQRLPCGLCRLTNSYCPLCGVTLPNQPYTWGVNLTDVGDKATQITSDGYHGVKLVAKWPIEELPSDEIFLSAFEDGDEDAD